jgi:CheY-like chemotaxis protein
MMPEMDGVETVKWLRDCGYNEPIVALTANALSGIDKMFLSNGFDDFISKPIEKRALKNILVKFIEERYPEEAAKQQKEHEQESISANAEITVNSETIETPPANDNSEMSKRSKKLTELFIIDANNAFRILPESAENDMKLFATTAHAMKSALANMGNMSLSDRAKELEFAGKDENKELISVLLPVFLDVLNTYVNELNELLPQETDTTEKADAISEENDKNENTNVIPDVKVKSLITALDNYDEIAAKAVIDEIKAQNPGKDILSLLSEITLKIMVSEFEQAAETAKKLMTSTINI